MATALLKKLDDLTECSICREECKDPRQLPCLHSFCLKCLEVYAGDKLLCRSMSCPLCRKETKVPHDGIKGFPRNFFIEKIMEIRRLSGPVTEAKKCDVCFGDEESAASSKDAAMYCTNCHYNLCTHCTNDHRRHMKKHCIVELGCGKMTEQLLETLATSYCSSHPQDPVRMFCLDCKDVICFVCFAEKHQMHKCSDINKEADIMRKQIESNIEGVSSCLLAFQQSTAEMVDKKKNFLKQIKTVEKDIRRRSNELKQIINRDRNALLNELESIKSSELKDMCVKTEELDRGVTVLNSFKAYGEEIVALGSASDVCYSYNQFHDRYDEITGNLKDPPFKEFLPKRVTFKTRSQNEVQQKNVVGRIEDISCKTEDDSDGLTILLSMNFREELERLKEMCIGSREIQEWKYFPFKFKQVPEVDESLFVLSIYTLIDDFTMAQYKVPDGIGVDNLAAALTIPVATDKMQVILFERGERVVKLIASGAQVAETKRSIELMAGKNLISDLLPEISGGLANDTVCSRIAETEVENYVVETEVENYVVETKVENYLNYDDENDYLDEDDWPTHSITRGRKKKSAMTREDKSKKMDEKKCTKAQKKRYNSKS